MLPTARSTTLRDYLCVDNCSLERLAFLSATTYAWTTSQVSAGIAVVGVSRPDHIDVRVTVGRRQADELPGTDRSRSLERGDRR